MKSTGDNGDEMSPTWLLDDETIEAIVAGDDVDARFDPVVAFARQVETLGDGAAPPVSPALEAVLAGPQPHGGRSRSWPGALTAAAARLAGLGAAARVGLGTSVAVVGLVGAGAAGVLPAQANERVRGAIEVVTPVDFGDGTKTPDTPAGGNPAGFGDRVSNDATGESDGLPGVDGGDVSGESPGHGARSGSRGDTADDDGQDRPRDTRRDPQGQDEADDSDDGGDDSDSDQSGDSDDDQGEDDDGDDERSTGREQAPGQVKRQTTSTTTTSTTTTTPAPTAPSAGNAGGGASPTAEED